MPIFKLKLDGENIAHAELVEAAKTSLELEKHLESWLEQSPWAIAGEPMLLISRQASANVEGRHQVVVGFLDKWKGEVEGRKNDFTEDSEERHALESLERELLFKKTDSLRRQVRALVRDSLEYLGHKEAILRIGVANFQFPANEPIKKCL